MSQNWKLLVWVLAGVALFVLTILGQHEADIRLLKRQVAELQPVKTLHEITVDGTPNTSVQGVNPVQTKDLMIPEDLHLMANSAQGVLLVKIVGDERVWEMRPRERKR